MKRAVEKALDLNPYISQGTNKYHGVIGWAFVDFVLADMSHGLEITILYFVVYVMYKYFGTTKKKMKYFKEQARQLGVMSDMKEE